MKKIIFSTGVILIMFFLFYQFAKAESGEVLSSQLNIARAPDSITMFNFLSHGINLLIKKGVSINSIVLILMFPVVVTIIAFFRQVVGVKAFGIYTPSIITISFLVMGLSYGLTVFFIILLTGSIVRFFIKKARILHVSAMAIILTITTLAVLFFLWVGAFYNKNNFFAVSLFPVLIMISLIEKFIAVQARKGLKNSIKLTLETVILSIICYYIASSQVLISLMLKYPEIIILLIIVNFFIGKWSGLRLLEYIRFWKVIKR